MRIALFGLGHVGTTMTACLAEAGHDVLGIDVSPAKVEAARRTPVVEPQLDALLLEGVRAGRISAAVASDERVGQADLAVVCVGTPPHGAGGLDLSALLAVASELGAAARRRLPGEPLLVVFRSTVPPGTMDRPAASTRGGRGRGAGAALRGSL